MQSSGHQSRFDRRNGRIVVPGGFDKLVYDPGQDHDALC